MALHGSTDPPNRPNTAPGRGEDENVKAVMMMTMTMMGVRVVVVLG